MNKAQKYTDAVLTEQKRRALIAVAVLKKLYPNASCSLEYGNDAWRLLVMARLSAQCTDARVNIVCRELFSRFPTAEQLADADISEIEAICYPCGLYRVKARDIKAASAIIFENGCVPDTMEGLLALPGVGRKIANLILGDIFGKPAIVTDTHCIRICARLGLYSAGIKTPFSIEAALVKIIPPNEQNDFCHRLVLFGRDICGAKKPECDICPLKAECVYKNTGKAE